VADATPSPSPPPRFPALVVAAFESGTLLVLDPPPPQQEPVSIADGGEDGDFEGASDGDAARVVIMLHLARHPLLAFALQDGDAGAPHGSRVVRGVATAAGAVVYVFELDVGRETGAVTRRLLLPAPGANAVAPFGGAALVGAWVGAVVRVGFGDGGGDGVEWWGGDGGGVASVAADARRGAWAVGDKQGRVAVWGRA
jgi:hypothetical protein